MRQQLQAVLPLFFGQFTGDAGRQRQQLKFWMGCEEGPHLLLILLREQAAGGVHQGAARLDIAGVDIQQFGLQSQQFLKPFWRQAVFDVRFVVHHTGAAAGRVQ